MFSGLRTARVKATLAATIIVAAALSVGGATVWYLQRGAMIAAIDTSLVARVDDLSALVADAALPAEFSVREADETLIQIVDDAGVVLAASSNIAGEGPLGIAVNGEDGSITTVTARLPIGESNFRVATAHVETRFGRVSIIAASSLEPVAETLGSLAAILAVTLPLLIGFVGLTVWVLVGRTLRPVEDIRRRVESIGHQELNRRVPVPETDDEIGRLAGTMNDMLARLEAAATQQRRFVADASHELRSPLAAIRSQLEVNLVHPESADWPSSGEEILDEALRLQRMVGDLLLLAKSDAGALTRSTKLVDVDDLVFEQLGHVARTDISIEMSGVSGAQLHGDADSLGRLVRNLVENAVRYARSIIRVTLIESTNSVQLTVEDDGPGVPRDQRATVFERFTRLDEARDRDHGGSGLGLAIASEIAHLHGGSIDLTDGSLGGACFSVILPRQ